MTNWNDEAQWFVTQPEGWHGAAYVHTGYFNTEKWYEGHICVCYGPADLALERARRIADAHNKGER